MSETALAPYRVTARNTAIASENKIHDDAVARRFGFAGALVPGVEVYAYLTHAPPAPWGPPWPALGRALPPTAGAGLCHAVLLLRLCKWALTKNGVLGPRIPAGSKVENFAAARIGDELTVAAVIRGNYERKGHRMVDLDGAILANARTLVARIEHTAIWRPRQVVAA